MKKLKFILVTVFMTLLSCESDDSPDIVALSNLAVSSEVVTDGTGKVTITATADGAKSYSFDFGDGSSSESLTGYIVKTYEMAGDNSYTITVLATGEDGTTLTETIVVNVSIAAEVPPEVSILTGDSSKTWYLAASQPGHLGVGPAREGIDGDWWYAKWYSAMAFEKCSDEDSDCLCDDELTFSINSAGEVTYVLDNMGQTFFNAAHLGVVGGSGEDDLCYDYDSSGEKAVTISMVEGNVPADETTGIQMDFADGGYMGYYVGSSTYEILAITEDLLYVRTYDALNPDLAWYHRFTSAASTGGGDETLSTIYTDLVWADEFDVDGAPDPANWTYDLGAGGWGNNESQTYTDDPSNVIVEGGMLKITANSSGGTAAVYYFDDINLVDPGVAISSVEDFEATAPAFSGFGGTSTVVIDNPDASGINVSTKVGESTKPVGAEVWAGSLFDLAAPLDLATYPGMSMKTWSPRAGAVIKLKLENSANADENFEVDAVTTVADAWEELSFDFSAAPAFSFDRVVLFFDFGESPSGEYTSARIKSENLFEFTYGRVEIRAKLPAAGGTWPALWALGANFDEVGWPACGELDIVEHVGNNANTILSTLHYEGSGASGITSSTAVPTATSEFHNYTMEWSPEGIMFVVDDEFIHNTFVNSADTPFNSDFFLIMNLAMGGNLGGAIDEAFTQDTMEVDYIRVYQ